MVAPAAWACMATMPKMIETAKKGTFSKRAVLSNFRPLK